MRRFFFEQVPKPERGVGFLSALEFITAAWRRKAATVKTWAFGILAASLMVANCVDAVPLDALDDTKEWRVEKVTLSGNEKFSQDELQAELLTKERPWYRPWEERPAFDPVTFENDLERLRRFYEAQGYYAAEMTYDLDINDEDKLVAAHIQVREGLPVIIAEIDVAVIGVTDGKHPALPDNLPVKRGAVFRETEFQQGEQVLRELFLRSGYAHVASTRKAEVDAVARKVGIEYTVTPGPSTVFGETEILGTVGVDPSLVRRELTYRPGEAFSSDRIAETRAKLLALNLFSSARVAPKETLGNPVVVPMVVEVAEAPPREFKVGLGYSTEEEFRGQAEWRHLNWLGGGRQLSVQGKYSSITAGGAVEFVQPHLFSPDTRGVLRFKREQENEETFLRNVTQFTPRVDYRFSAALTGFVGYRVEYDQLNDVAVATVRALGGVRREGLLSGPTMGVVWNTTDSPFYPKRGGVLSFSVEQAGAIWGGAYSFYKLTGEAKKYYGLGWDTIFASRLKLGFGDAIGGDDRYPLFERYYAGGEKSVRGFGRRRLGPLSASDDPLGGLSLLEGSLELRRPIWGDLGGAVFLDAGHVALRRFDLRIANVKLSSGFGLSYDTPVGPIRLDVGFPFERPSNDRPWRIHFSIGAFF